MLSAAGTRNKQATTSHNSRHPRIRDQPIDARNASPCPKSGQDKEQYMRSALQGDSSPCRATHASPLLLAGYAPIARTYVRARNPHVCTCSTQPKQLAVRCVQRGHNKMCLPPAMVKQGGRDPAAVLHVHGTPLTASFSCPLAGWPQHDDTWMVQRTQQHARMLPQRSAAKIWQTAHTPTKRCIQTHSNKNKK
jgi:hypothetical protein